jgi:hypothetical protein
LQHTTEVLEMSGRTLCLAIRTVEIDRGRRFGPGLGSIVARVDPQPPGQETNWISTSKGRPFFLLFRNYAPEKSVLERTYSWVLNDVEKTN